MTFKSLLAALLASALTVGANASNFDQEAVIAKMRADGIECLSGVADDTGFWVVAIGTSRVTGKTEKKAFEMARTDARASMAKSFSVEVSSAAESYYGECDNEIKESFATWSRTDTNELLAGLKIIKTYIDGDLAVAAAIITEHHNDATSKLKQKMSELPPGTVEANGEGATKREAIDMACRSALEQVNGARVVASDASVDDEASRSRVYADVQGLVSSYRILSEEQVDGRWNVVIVASIDKDELQESYGAQLKSIGDPLFFICGDNDDAIKLMSDYFIQKGFKTTTNKGTSDYKIELTAGFAEIVDRVDGGKGTQLQLKAVCFDKAGVQLFAIENDPRKACSYSGTPSRQMQICVKKAVKQVGKPLHGRIQKAIADLVNNGRTVRMVFRNITTKDQTAFIESLVGEVNDMPGAGSATFSLNESVSVATLRFTLKGNPEDFMGLLRTRVPELPAALSVSTNKIVFEF